MPVEDFFSFNDERELIFVAKCHGAEQVVNVPLEGIQTDTIELGLAFADGGQ